MTDRSVTHAMFRIERVFDASVRRVFQAFADPARKKQWACHEDWQCLEMDFRVGGREVNRGGEPGGPVYGFVGVYLDIVDNARFVLAYAMERDGVRISVSVITAEFTPEGAGARLIFTEQGAFLDGHESPSLREQGSGVGLDNLAELLRREAAAA